MHIFIPDLHKDRSAFRQQIPCNGQTIPQVGQVRMNPMAPGISEGFHLFGFSGDVFPVAVLDVPAGGGPLEVGVEFDAVGRVHVDALDFAAQAFPFCQGCHHLQAVSEDHAVGPVGVVPVEFRPGAFAGESVEVREQVELVGLARTFPLLALPHQVVDQDLGMDFFLDVKRWSLHHQVGPVLLILSPPDQLGIEVPVAAFVGRPDGVSFFLVHDGLVFDRRDVSP